MEDGKWGLRLNVPPSVIDAGVTNNSLWVHEGPNLRVIIDFSRPPSPELLQRKKNYLESRLNIHGLPALLCAYDEPAARGALTKVVQLVFLETRKGLGSPYEPSYRVEYRSEGDRPTAMEILQTVRFYQS